MPDVHHPPTVLAGCYYRFLREMKPIKHQRMRRFQKFVRKWVESNISPLTVDQVPTVEEWLESTIYPQYRKTELLLISQEMGDVPASRRQGHFVCKSFGKTEAYIELALKLAQYIFDLDNNGVGPTVGIQDCFKHARGINSRHDAFKVYSGPFFKAMEKDLFSLHYFIKKVAVAERPRYLSKVLHGWKHYYETDYTSFEAGFCPEFLRSCELVLYRRYLQNFPVAYAVIADALAGENRCLYTGFTVKVKGTRMSGDMCTSLGNGFSNLMMFLFAAEESGVDCDGVVEGDDGLMGCSGPVDPAVFSELGFDIKIVEHQNYMRAAFCGIVASSEMTIMKDARKVLVTFGWSHSPLIRSGQKVLLGLLRSKALSLLYEAPRCPILTVLALHYLSLTEGVQPREPVDWWSRTNKLRDQRSLEDVMKEVDLGINEHIRYDYQVHYGISIAQQLAIEDEIRSCGLNGIDGPTIQSLYPADSGLRRYDAEFVSPTGWDEHFD